MSLEVWQTTCLPHGKLRSTDEAQNQATIQGISRGRTGVQKEKRERKKDESETVGRQTDRQTDMKET